MGRRTGVLCLVIAGAGVACAQGPERTGEVTENHVLHESDRLSLRFRYPGSFVVGRFAEERLPPGADAQGFESPFRDAVVLVEPGQLGDFPLEAIPVGEVPTISVEWVKNPIIFSLLREGTEMMIGGRRAFRFPGYPGPYGDQAHYYVVEMGPGRYLELMAHRSYFRDAEMRETAYDHVIEAVIASLEPISP
jgi:hypothetical protein